MASILQYKYKTNYLNITTSVKCLIRPAYDVSHAHASSL